MRSSSISKCLACGTSEMFEVLDLGSQEPANLYGEKGRHESLSLVLVACRICGHAQQLEHYDHEVLFGEYLYSSGTSGTLKNYFKSLAKVFSKIFSTEARVLELASNDGSFLDEMNRFGLVPIGVDPSRLMSERARQKGHLIIEDFWPTKALSGQNFDLVVAQNVLAHVPQPLEFLKSIGDVLTPEGVVFIQTSQAAMVENGEFDTIYHEHYSFFNERSIEELAARSGLSVHGFSYVSVHGGSMVSLLSDRGSTGAKCLEVASALASREFPFKSRSPDIRRPSFDDWREFALIARQKIDATGAEIAKLGVHGQSIVAVGAAAKAVTFLRASEIAVTRVVDEAKDKIGKEIPGVTASVANLESVCSDPDGTIYLITAWNFYDELKAKIEALRDGQKQVFMRVFPELLIE